MCPVLLQGRRQRRRMWRKASLAEVSASGLDLLSKVGKRRRWRTVQTTALAFDALPSGGETVLTLFFYCSLFHLKRVILLAVVICTL